MIIVTINYTICVYRIRRRRPPSKPCNSCIKMLHVALRRRELTNKLRPQNQLTLGTCTRLRERFCAPELQFIIKSRINPKCLRHFNEKYLEYKLLKLSSDLHL